jgi:hypothetical protein
MNPSDFAKLNSAIENAIDEIASDGNITYYVYGDLVTDMTKAASLVYDASMKAQEFSAENE